MPLGFRNQLLNGTARGGLNNDEIEQHDPEEGGDYQRKAPEDITAHSAELRQSCIRDLRHWSVLFTHQLLMSTPFLGTVSGR